MRASLTGEVVEAVPIHGEDFCDSCGDCLSCYGSDPCGQYGDEGHSWVVYEDEAAEFWSNHPEARPA